MALRLNLILVAALLLIMFSACNMSALFDENVTIDKAKWSKDDIIEYDLVISDTLSQYDFYINLRNTADYRFQNLYIFLTTRFPNNNITRDTIEFILADQAGKWLGKGWGNLKENDILLKSNLTFPLTGDYSFLVQHAMRADTLNGINNIGIRIEKSN